MDPTEAERTAMVNMAKVFSWAGFVEGDIINANTVTGSLASLLGVTQHVAPRVIGIISEADYDSAVTRWKVPQIGSDGNPMPGGGSPPTMAQLGAAKLVGRACRVIAGNGTTIEDLKAMAAKASAPPPTTPTAAASSSAALRKVKLSAVLSQVDDSEIDVLDEKEILKGYLRYEAVYGKGERPPKDSEPTSEQIISIHHLVKQGHPPYADFAIFGPYGHRLYKKIKLSGVTIGKDGTLRAVELHGPANIALWSQSYQVLVNTLVMLDTVDLGTLLKYKEKIEKFHDRYGEKIWAVLYQVAKGSSTDFDPDRPWNYVWQVVIGDESFWRDEVTEPGVLILTKVANVGEMLEGDARVDQQAPGAGPRETHPAPARLTEVSSGSGHHPRNANRTGRFHRVEGGKYLSNRTGYKLCEAYNSAMHRNITGSLVSAQCGHRSSM